MKPFKLSKNFFIAFIYILLLALTVSLSIYLQRLFDPHHFSRDTLVSALSFHYYWIYEFSLMSLIAIWLSSANRWIRSLHYVCAFFFLLVVFVQILSVMLSQDFISSLSLENLGHLALLVNPQTLSLCGLFLVSYLSYVIFMEKNSRRRPSSLMSNVWLSCSIIIGSLIMGSSLLLSDQALAQRTRLFEDRMMGASSPVTSFVRVVTKRRVKTQTDFLGINEEQINWANKLSFDFFDSGSRRYPLVKNYVYKSDPPFPQVAQDESKPNIIIFFTEGTSSRLLGIDHPKFPNLTPHIDSFAKHPKVMNVENYFNHTAATYRGLHGQLCSIYPTFGGFGGWDNSPSSMPKMSNLCLPQVFNVLAYDSVFLDCHLRDNAYVKDLVKKVGFKTVYNAEDMQKFIPNETFKRHDGVSDYQLMRSLVAYLKNRTQTKSSAPLILGVYNLGTHANQPLSVDGIPYGDNSNSVLSTLHNYDYSFGFFWTWFQQSDYANNTVVIFTTDHANYPEPDLLSIVTQPYQPYFVDRIPLMIYSPYHQLPKTYDANYRNSLDFAPSLLHLLGVRNFRNHFLGNSIFEEVEEKVKGMSVANYGDEYFFIDKEGISRATGVYAEKGQKYKEVIELTKTLEVTDRLWKDEWNEDIFESFLRSNLSLDFPDGPSDTETGG